ncbi:MAG: methyltransferase domain-containing protein [Gemmatimonadota bacterium]|nr:methyltransferase domain-containing protein [Gemmatimonadota bacterium]
MDFIVVSTIEKYRELAQSHITSGHQVLEIGCSYGETTNILAGLAKRVVAIDIAAEMISHARKALSQTRNVELVLHDARDLSKISELIPRPHAIFIDIGGNQQLDKIATVLRSCLTRFKSELLVVRNVELAGMVSLVTEVEDTCDDRSIRTWKRDRCSSQSDLIAHLMDLSSSYLVSNRTYAVRQLKHHIDIPEVLNRILGMKTDDSPTVRRIAAGILMNHVQVRD